MKICYLADINSVHTKKWCNYFKKLGHEIHVISLNEGHLDGAEVHCLKVDKAKTKASGVLGKFEYILRFKEVRRLVKEIKPDILHAHYASSYGLLGALADYHPYILSLWGSDVYDFPRKGYIFKKMLQYNLKAADIIMSTSKAMAKEARKYLDTEMLITPFGVDINKYQPMWNKNTVEQKIIIGTVKALEEVYGIETLIRAFAHLYKSNKNIALEIAGEGSQRDYLLKLCKDLKIDQAVTIFGRLPEEEVVKAFNRFHIAVFPSLRESFGVAAVEAQACGTPVVVSDADGLLEVTVENKTGLVVRERSPEAYAEAINKLILDEALRKSMGQCARVHVENNFDIENNFSKVKDIYENLISNRGSE
ncbi:glycosyltransferase [Clostridium thermarum]|uniref:glycosyltransferase n=1 Tax=Clostridium thermarum TaxID=1716543 RepID=UPI0011241891|nr:glycosyltransferase [Clostridium thermarum]